MIPVFLLDVQPHHLVLDMCAAPGSKTAQIVEAVHSQELSSGDMPTGMIVANDVDVKRAYMLVHQTRRVGSPGIVITNHAGQFFPNLNNFQAATAATATAAATSVADAAMSRRYARGMFDRVLCDVPCSGDGTIRKAGEIWRTWHLSSGAALHPLQIQIAMRGVALTKVGGLMVYSTCSFNPIENEAVVAELMRRCDGSLEIVDASAALPALKRRAGLTEWEVQLRHFPSFLFPFP